MHTPLPASWIGSQVQKEEVNRRDAKMNDTCEMQEVLVFVDIQWALQSVISFVDSSSSFTTDHVQPHGKLVIRCVRSILLYIPTDQKFWETGLVNIAPAHGLVVHTTHFPCCCICLLQGRLYRQWPQD